MTEPIEPIAPDPAPVASVPAPAPTPAAVPIHTQAGGATRLTSPGARGAAPAHGHEEGGLHRVVGFIAWVFGGFGLVAALRKGPRFADQEILVYSAHRAFFLWPLVFTGFIGAWIVGSPWIVSHWTSAPVFMGWFYIWVLAYTLVSILFDISTWKFVLWAGIFAFIYILSRYVEMVKNVQILSHLFHYMHHLQPKLDHGFAIMMGWLLLIPWIGSLFSTFTNGRKRFTPNEISEWHMGDGSELTDRTGLKFRSKYRDVFETLLGFGAGDLLAIDGTGVVRKRWENILFLFFIWKRMDEILHQRAAVVDNEPNEPVEVEEVREARHHPAAHP
jgi:hypothetical protein